ncbi:MAG TPA: CHAP domain-containing protein [Candidatus Dormibacteraeota bacterium]|nr:CHAP domain-containing protein [Candidatus Dormibacteraeota bacterium]
MAAAMPWIVLHVPVGASPALAGGSVPGDALAGAPFGRSVDGIGWSMSGSLVVPALPVTPPSDKHRDIIHYQAVDGDTLRAVATKYGLSVNTLLWSNPKLVDKLTAGQAVVIPPVDGVLVTVSASDTLASLAQKYRAETDAIIEFNLLRHPESLPVGQYLMVPYGVGPEPPSAPPSNAHTVTVGRHSWFVTPIWSSGGGLYPFGQCTWYVNTRRPAPWGGNAWQWYSRAKAYGRPVGATPRVGAIMVTWESPYWGHVAYVEQVYGDGSWLVSEMNYASPSGGGWGRVSYRHVIPGTIPLIGFIY